MTFWLWSRWSPSKLDPSKLISNSRIGKKTIIRMIIFRKCHRKCGFYWSTVYKWQQHIVMKHGPLDNLGRIIESHTCHVYAWIYAWTFAPFELTVVLVKRKVLSEIISIFHMVVRLTRMLRMHSYFSSEIRILANTYECFWMIYLSVTLQIDVSKFEVSIRGEKSIQAFPNTYVEMFEYVVWCEYSYAPRNEVRANFVIPFHLCAQF